MVMLKGVQCREATHLGWRYADQKRDVRLDGRPMQEHHVAIVRIADCRTYEENGRDMYDPKDAPSIPINHGGTWYGYGKDRTQNRQAWVYDRKSKRYALVSRYITTPFYAVKDGVVFQGSIKKPIRDEKGEAKHVITWEKQEEAK